MMWVWGAAAAGLLWLLTLSFLVKKMRDHYTRLTARTKKGSIDEILESLLQQDHQLNEKISTLEKKTHSLEEASFSHFQKIGFVRFNPFERVGGEQSFVIALLDKKDSGLILNFLYIRDGIRVYAKKIQKGRSAEYELSSEEKEALKNADSF